MLSGILKLKSLWLYLKFICMIKSVEDQQTGALVFQQIIYCLICETM
jgi:hypothetical protein